MTAERAVIKAEWAIRAAGLALTIIAALLGLMWADISTRLSTLEACVWDFNARIVRLESRAVALHPPPTPEEVQEVLASLFGD